MNWLVYHVASGHAFFTGVAFVVIAALLSLRPKRLANRLAVLLILLGVIAIAVSSTAIPYWYYAVAVFAAVPWAISRYFKKWQRCTTLAVIAAWLGAAAFEIPYHIMPTLKPTASRAITVIGDSVTAGVGDGDKSEKWPAILARQHGLAVQNISHMGETAASALKRVRQHPISASVVILEIGGNDLLGSTTSAQFKNDLDALLAYVSAPGRQLIMFELPLPPFHHEFGRIQRSLGAKYNVSLIPKRVLLSILGGEDATLDTIHLSQTGHTKMAARVGELLRLRPE